MSADYQKFSFQKNLGLIAQQQAKAVVSQLGQSLPCTVVSVAGYMITVKIDLLAAAYNFPNITVPLAASRYTTEPIQQGDQGILIPCDASIAAISGQGSVSDTSQPGNLSALIFQPVGNVKWNGTNPQIHYITGLADVMLRDTAHQVTLEGENTAWLSLISQINTLLTVIGPLLTTPTTLTPIMANTNPVVIRT